MSNEEFLPTKNLGLLPLSFLKLISLKSVSFSQTRMRIRRKKNQTGGDMRNDARKVFLTFRLDFRTFLNKGVSGP